MTARLQEAGTIRSGDVNLYYRRFGAGAGTPLLIAHGANYYDSADWIGVATNLADAHEVVAWDTRGFGRSDWSPRKDYSWDAQMADIHVLMDRFGWSKAVILGHSFGGAYAMLFAARFPERTAGLVIVDHCPIGPGGNPQPLVQSINNKAKIYRTPEDALPDLSRDASAPQAARLAEFMKPVDGGFVLTRDPDFANRVPVDGSAGKILVTDMWTELANISAPTLLIRAKRSDRYQPAALERIARDYPQIKVAELDCGHDVVAGASSNLVSELRDFLARATR